VLGNGSVPLHYSEKVLGNGSVPLHYRKKVLGSGGVPLHYRKKVFGGGIVQILTPQKPINSYFPYPLLYYSNKNFCKDTTFF